MGLNDRAIDIVNRPVHLPSGISLLVDGLQEVLPETSLVPAIEAAGHRAPGAIVPGQITLGSARAQHPQDAVEEALMVQSGSAG